MKKLLLIALAALSFGTASAYEDKDTHVWKWDGAEKPAEIEGASGTYYIRNVQTGMFLKTAETTLYVDNGTTCAVDGSLFTFTFHKQKDGSILNLGYKSDGYVIKNKNGRYLTWGGATFLYDLAVNSRTPCISATSQYATHMMAGSKEEGYNIWFPSNIANTGISSGNYYLYVDESNPNTLTKSSKEDEKSPFAHWQLISQDEMKKYHEYVQRNELNLYKGTFGSYIKNNHEYSKIYVHRKLNAGYNTIALPFDVADVEAAFGSGAYVSEFTGAKVVNGAFTLTFTKKSKIEANKPYILHLDANTGDVLTFGKTIVVNEVSKSATFENWTFQSNYYPNLSMEGKYGVVNSTAKIMRGEGEKAIINGLTAYFTFNGTALNSVQAIFVDGQGELTDIQQLAPVATENGQTIYTISGQRVNNAVNGINIINGRKVLKK